MKLQSASASWFLSDGNTVDETQATTIDKYSGESRNLQFMHVSKFPTPDALGCSAQVNKC